MPSSDSNPPVSPGSSNQSLRDEAARWVVRRDRGLSAEETAEFVRWLEADPRRSAAVERSIAAWGLLGQISEEVAATALAQPMDVSEARPKKHGWRWAALGLAAAACIAITAKVSQRPEARLAEPAIATHIETIAPKTVTLADGTLVQLNAGAEVIEQFTEHERRVLLRRGEAHFAVTKNPARPFVVSAGGIEVRAVGTAFNVHLESRAVEVLVTEGKVRLEENPGDTAKPAGVLSQSVPHLEAPLVVAGQRAVISTGSINVVVSQVNRAEEAELLAWREPLLRLGGATLAELAIEFERHTGNRLVLADPALAELRIGGRFRADDIEGFVRLLGENYGVVVQRRGVNEIVLQRAQ